MKALQIAATGMAAQQMKVDVVSNNLANMSTTGYNPRRADFADLTYQQMARPGSVTAENGAMLPTGIQIGLGVRPASVSVVLGQGSLDATGADLDLAIDGNGYIEVTLPSGGSAYTRDGALKRSADGQIVTSDGHPVAPGITIPSDARGLTITPTGEVFADFADQVAPTLIGSLTLTSFVNEKGLEAIGSNLFLESPASGPPTTAQPGLEGLGTLRQGYLESSSVDAVREVTELIKAQRGYELNAKVITAADQMLSATTQVR
ncbi:MAG: flagellar basal-body rod protein FlgG [Tabrizicola sp.]|uniref:flagellar basal-body rod protein FlgG n=1 Tax=Tabrizicola sp. TaxID=2005166 RepID=UPI002734BA1F|nr:flagellar basal-body rod protein FlgG [Tabrizicola sp.]MDP3262483.1 flagellar basal-body rod protein FlgG [Tabrizicola sp.]MDP3648497.1 flagellar basal-body rod protein FlgG [Paracoccaceae bacterium]MDZ4066024.1 flagellar basal-body rod protein FlgG [Tabrizicola sp.]